MATHLRKYMTYPFSEEREFGRSFNEAKIYVEIKPRNKKIVQKVFHVTQACGFVQSSYVKVNDQKRSKKDYILITK